ncbi:VOC family protein [Halogeometricum sp. S1BR25-6]|uniref:VOC family protein n=1 Tax=Halogeometricum salsisoli TaxID=2950536 RepID=A0ABU2GGV5_9EURY|nr:VOC family protein [Halogeometricum sp. S1BR25-6]MDS0300056.1 VOC family protein [Halogeometricum sp. S1BR25-6]
MTRSPLVPDAARIGRTALTVADLDATTAFYRDVVGLSVLSETETMATLGVDGTPLLVLRRDEDAPPRTDDRAGLFHNAFRVPSRAALGAALERIRDRSELTGASDHDVSEALYLVDPEGNGVEIYADRPQEEWPRAVDGTISMGTAPLDLDDLLSASDGAAAAPPGTTVGHVHLEATSLPASRAFYADTLGLRVQSESSSALFLAAGDYHHHLGVNVWNGRARPAGGRGVAWVEFLLPDAESLAAVRRGLAAADVSVTDRDEGFEVSDPSGVAVRFRLA